MYWLRKAHTYIDTYMYWLQKASTYIDTYMYWLQKACTLHRYISVLASEAYTYIDTYMYTYMYAGYISEDSRAEKYEWHALPSLWVDWLGGC